MLRAAHAIIHPDPADRSHILRWLAGSKAQVECIPIRSAVDVAGADTVRVSKWRAELAIPSTDSVLLYFGTLGPEKGIVQLLDATASLRDRGRRVHLLVVGNLTYYPESVRTSTESTLARLKTAAGQGWATLVDSASPELVSRCHHVSDIAVLPLLHGAAANRSSLLVAMAHGLPIVTTRGPSTPDDFPHSDVLHMVPPGDSDLLASGIDSLLTHEARRAALGSAAADAYGRMPTWSKIADRTLALYRQLAMG